MFGIGTWELVIILVLALVILGPAKIPQMARSIGRGMAQLRKSVNDVKREIDIEGLREEVVKESGLDQLKKSLDVDQIKNQVERELNETDLDLDSLHNPYEQSPQLDTENEPGSDPPSNEKDNKVH